MSENTLNNKDLGKDILASDDVSLNVLMFNVRYMDLKEKFCLPRAGTVATLQKAIHQEFCVSPDYQILRGCGLNDADSDEAAKIPLTSLSLSSDNCVYVSEVKFRNISFEILDETNEKTINLNLPNTTTIQEMKQNIYCITNIPVRFQQWSGFPKIVQADAPLWKAGFGLVSNVLLKVSSSEEQSLLNITSSASELATDSETESDDAGSESDPSLLDWEITDAVNTTQPLENALIGSNTNNLVDGTTLFVQNYKLRFGEPMIDFYVGELRSAFQEASLINENRKLFAIYLHHCDSILTNIFCHHVLKNDAIQKTFKNLFIVYGWDLTKESKGSYFFRQLESVISPKAAQAAEDMCLDKLPAFMFVSKEAEGNRANLSVLHGDVGVDELRTRLQEQYDLMIGLV
ncbi:uncharacterized protein Dana_GF23849 [Drosophila ananassae]|uniref:UAS domain-containing protein n=1 Tax=Drosophila ananassae TaxID=7217 RepID=B3M588_DROAN|nr:FAS-associated factor 1 [Drosophila ananassae]EDV40593.1 uncharacterized protein Dana_GF23849 [Drosophila ananassae]